MEVIRTAVLCVAMMALCGCASAPSITPDDPHFPAVSFIKQHDGAVIGDALLVNVASIVPTTRATSPSLTFDADRSWAYVSQYGRTGNDCPDGQLDSDCAHFQAHALAAGGVRVAHCTAVCRSQLTLRVKDLAIAFDNAGRRYANVLKFNDYRLSRRGDYCFLARAAGGTHDHMMLLAATPDSQGARVYSHTNNRNGEYVHFDPERCVFFRIESSVGALTKAPNSPPE